MTQTPETGAPSVESVTVAPQPRAFLRLPNLLLEISQITGVVVASKNGPADVGVPLERYSVTILHHQEGFRSALHATVYRGTWSVARALLDRIAAACAPHGLTIETIETPETESRDV